MPVEPATTLAYPLARWADRRLKALAEVTGSERIAALNGPQILGERALGKGYRVPGKVSAGLGGGRIMRARDGWFALTIARPDDRMLLPILFRDENLDSQDNEAIKAAAARFECGELVALGRLLGLACASTLETPPSPAVSVIARGPRREREPGEPPLVLDLTAVWAGPLAAHLLWLAGARVVKIETRTRPDVSRDADPNFFARMNQGKDSVVVDFARPEEKAALVALMRRADIVIESSRPRGLQQLGIDADALVRECPGLVWLNLTGYGASGEPANWTGFGHDSGVCGGLTTALERASGSVGYVGDALPDPLTGITAATEAWRAFTSGEASRIGLALSGVAALALKEEREHDAAALDDELRAWAAARGQLLPDAGRRAPLAELRPLGADTAKWLSRPAPC